MVESIGQAAGGGLRPVPPLDARNPRLGGPGTRPGGTSHGPSRPGADPPAPAGPGPLPSGRRRTSRRRAHRAFPRGPAMPAPAAADDLLELVRKSGLVDPLRLQAALEEAPAHADAPATPKQLAAL